MKTDDLMLTTSEVRKIEALCTRFEHLDSVTKALQSDNVKIVQVKSNIIGLNFDLFFIQIISLTEKEIIQVQSQLQ